MKKSFSLIVAAAFYSTQMTAPVYADGRDFLTGAIIGGAIGAIAGSKNRIKQKRTNTKKRSSGSSRPRMTQEQRENNKDLQRRLNSLGYNAGTPDGVLGRNSKAAISAFQRDNGMPPTGKLSNEQMAVLYQMSHGGAAPTASYGGPVVPGAQVPAPAFPAVQNGLNSSNSAFPEIGGAGASQPQFAAPPSGQFNNQMPNFGTPAAPMANPAAATAATLGTTGAVMALPAVSGHSEGEVAGGQVISTANTNLNFASGKPAVLGVQLGEAFATALTKLQDNGYQQCEGQTEFIKCSVKRENVAETMTLARGLQDANVPVYFMDRTTMLKVDVDQSVIDAKVAEAYPEIAGAPNRVLSNSAECAAHMAELSNIDSFSSALAELRQQDKPVNEWLEQTLDVCSTFYKVNVSHDGAQYRVRVVMFDGTYLKNDVARLGQQSINKVNNALKF